MAFIRLLNVLSTCSFAVFLIFIFTLSKVFTNTLVCSLLKSLICSTIPFGFGHLLSCSIVSGVLSSKFFFSFPLKKFNIPSVQAPPFIFLPFLFLFLLLVFLFFFLILYFFVLRFTILYILKLYIKLLKYN